MFSKIEIEQKWGNGKTLIFKGKAYRVGRMSYGDFFLEPFNSKYPLGRGEKYPFARGTLWLERADNKGNYKII